LACHRTRTLLLLRLFDFLNHAGNSFWILNRHDGCRV